MKNLILALTAALSLNAFATSPISIDPNVIMTFTRGGGMTGPGGLSYRKISVTKDGVVNVEETRESDDWSHRERYTQREYVLATIPPRDMLEIGQTIGALEYGRLVKPKRPVCMDAPSQSYVVNKNGAAITVFFRAGCIDHEFADPAQRARSQVLKGFLDQLNEMAK